MTKNKKEFQAFFKITKKLNKEGITPILFGSLGLCRFLGDFKKVGDVDIFLENGVCEEKKVFLKNLMKDEGFRVIDEEKCEFEKEGVVVSFESFEKLRVPINFKEISEEEGANFYEVSLKDYRDFYKRMLEDKERRKRKGQEDEKKILLVEKYLNNFEKKEIIKPNPRPVRLFFFLVGIIATVAYRIIIVLNLYSPLWVKVAWYIGTVGFVIYFWHRYSIAKKRSKLIERYGLVDVVEKLEINSQEKEALQYLVRTSLTSKSKWNSGLIFILSLVALFLGIVLDILGV